VRRTRLAALALLLTGCSVQPSGVTDGAQAPTGLAPGVTLYFVNTQGRLQPQLRRTGHLGTIDDAMQLLLTGPGDTDLSTGIAPVETTIVLVNTITPGLIQLTVPLAIRDVAPLGIDQLVCTALGVYVQGGGSKSTQVQVRFTLPTPESYKRRTCPLIR
jgi:hypothetical protein